MQKKKHNQTNKQNKTKQQQPPKKSICKVTKETNILN